MTRRTAMPRRLALAFAFLSTPLLATPYVQDNDRSITVTGERLSPSEARKRSNEFVNVTTALSEDQYSRGRLVQKTYIVGRIAAHLATPAQ